MRPTLVTLPAEAPRPTEKSEAVIRATMDAKRSEIAAWFNATHKGEEPYSDDDHAELIRRAALAGGEGFKVAASMTDYDWRMNAAGARLIFQACDELGFRRRLAEREWIMLHKLRVPAKDGDTVEFVAQVRKAGGGVEDLELAGTVAAVDRTRLMLVVELVGDGGYKLEGATRLRIGAEAIFANVTQGLYAVEGLGGESVVLPDFERVDPPAPVTPLPPRGGPSKTPPDGGTPAAMAVAA